MFKEIFKQKNKLATEFIENSLNLNRQIQGLILEGDNPFVQYFFAIETARILNCKNGKQPDCDCINCKWIKEGIHPALSVVSPINFKPASDKSTTVISVEQTQEIIKTLSVSSDYHRVFIFTDAKIEKSDIFTDDSLKSYENYFHSLPEENWRPLPLGYNNFQEEASNSLLKILEEPPLNVSFIFLTKNKNDLISTIVSRAFALSLSSERISWDYSFIGDIFSQYPNFKIEDVYLISDKLSEFSKENEVSWEYILNSLEMWLEDCLKKNLHKSIKIIADLKHVAKAKAMIKAFILPQNAIEYMLIEMMKNG